MKITSKEEKEIRNDLVDGRINERVCSCCGVCSDDAIEPVEIVD